MRNLANCYSEHAVKVSDSYCSGPVKKQYNSPKSIQSIQNNVTFTYKVNICNQKSLFITVTWCNKLICQGFFIKISENMSNSQQGFHKISKIQGHKSLEIISNDQFPSKVDIHWDLSLASFETVRPVPIVGYYIIVIMVESRSGIVLGDTVNNCPNRDNLMSKMVNKPEFTLVSQYEQFTGSWNNQINTKVKLRDSGTEHEIMVKCSPEDSASGNVVLSMYVDKKRVVSVEKLQWNFRGNQVIFVEGLLVDVMWDVFGWYYGKNVGVNGGRNGKNGCGWFLFRTRSGLESRLWLEEEKHEEDKMFGDKNLEFSLLICANMNLT